MRELLTKRGGCISLLLGGLLSLFLLLKILSGSGWWRSDLLWMLSPGWRIFPFGHADLGAMLVGTGLNALLYSLAIYSAIRAMLWLFGKRRE